MLSQRWGKGQSARGLVGHGEDLGFDSEVEPQEGSEQVRALIWLRYSQEPSGCRMWVWKTDCLRWGESSKTGRCSVEQAG